ncbi:phosphoribosyltransferase family protein [Allobranchiibius huperziae]|uniref:Orotate phosphoribosyltransferase n=1 Tax=Allobranchiibius huperziae TaxID=1874116 RepID=A0A853DDG6_9MICO|nr:phosphoribosyltransferase family protein [Allobranchiibius huperziae]NYJ75616.1 orotate phosphoribosyltransferase [Allobranchiibius huperziae]
MEPDDLLSLMGARRGHFVFESGYHGDLWLDLDGMFAAPAQLASILNDLSRQIAAVGPDVVCGPMTGGALVAFAVATKLEVGFRWIYREQTPSGQGLFPYRYYLDAAGAELANQRVVVVDDVINAGSATRETLRLLREQHAIPVAVAALLTLGQAPEKLARDEGLDLVTLANAESPLWMPDHCPLCAADEPVTSA